jgi:prepilin-type N-terminal cleavage/methylation domain-containing protein
MGLSPSRGFTLVELLTVIVIIGMLVAMITAAAIPARNYVRNARMKTEITQLALALEAFKTEFGDYPPDGKDPAGTTMFLARAFPRYSGGLPTGITLDPSNALTFWLGGMYVTTGTTSAGFRGFSANPLSPFDTTQPSRKGPFFNFDVTRTPYITTSGTNSGWYLPQNDNASSAPFVYFKAMNTSGTPYSSSTYTLSSVTVRPYAQAVGGMVNPDTFQILCPGLDAQYDNTRDGNNPIYPTGSNYKQPGYMLDDITNFSNGKVSDNMNN